MRDEHGVPVEPAEELCYLRIPTNKMRGEFYVPIPGYVADAIEVWESVPRQTRERSWIAKPTNSLNISSNTAMT